MHSHESKILIFEDGTRWSRRTFYLDQSAKVRDFFIWSIIC